VTDLHNYIVDLPLFDFAICVQIVGCIAPHCQLTKMRISRLWVR